MIGYTWKKKKTQKNTELLHKTVQSQAESWAFLPVVALAHITYTKDCIIPFQYCVVPHIPEQQGGS